MTTTERRRRFRISVRLLMLLPILTGLVLWLADRLWVTSWVQSGTQLASFVVIDAESSRPIEGAVITLIGEYPPEQGRRPPQTEAKAGAVATTGPEGAVSLALPHDTLVETSLLRKVKREGFAWTMHVSADGYQTMSTSLANHRRREGLVKSYVAGSVLLHDPTIVRLQPQPRPAR